MSSYFWSPKKCLVKINFRLLKTVLTKTVQEKLQTNHPIAVISFVLHTLLRWFTNSRWNTNTVRRFRLVPRVRVSCYVEARHETSVTVGGGSERILEKSFRCRKGRRSNLHSFLSQLPGSIEERRAFLHDRVCVIDQRGLNCTATIWMCNVKTRGSIFRRNYGCDKMNDHRSRLKRTRDSRGPRRGVPTPKVPKFHLSAF